MPAIPFFSPQRLTPIPAERFMVSLPALRSGSRYRGFSPPRRRRAGGSARQPPQPAAVGAAGGGSPVAPVADLQSVVILSDPGGLVLHTVGDTQAMQRRSASRWRPAICGAKAGVGPTPSAPRWRLTTAAKSMAVSTFSPATRICTARRCRSSGRTEVSPACWISPARRIFPTSTPLAG